MLTLANVTLRRGPRKLLEGLSFTVHPGWRLGVVGRNGTGKTSLFSLLLGEIQPDAGECQLPRQLTIATVAQETPTLPQPAIEFVLDGDTELRALQQALAAAETAHDAASMARLHDRMAAVDGYAARARAGRLLHGLGFAAEEQMRPYASFSGGWRMRLNLARTLMTRADLMLLDEPTNHLDLDAVIWLQSWLAGYAGTLLVISHDREFLDAVTTHTLHLHQGTAQLYSGNYSQFERQRAERAAQQNALAARQGRQIAHLQSFVDRFRAKATKARQAQARLKMIERMLQVAPAHADSEFSFGFLAPARLPSPLLRLDAAAVGYGDQTVLSGIKCLIAPGERIGLLGPNGAGKSTFMRLLAGDLATTAGETLRAPDLAVGYFAQHQLEQLDVQASPLLHLRRLDADATEQSLRNFLGGFNFRGDRVFEPVAPFSGGEKARLALALVVYRRPNLLLLDEPTNHLDLDMRQALELALQDFAGAVVLVSHDRHLLRATCDTLWLVANGRIADFDGDLDDYARWLAQRDEGGAGNGGRDKPSAHDQRRAAAEQRQREKPLRDALRGLEQRMSQLQRRLDAIETRLGDALMYEDTRKAELARLLQEQGELRRELGSVEHDWLQATEQLEQSGA